jgi:hypothetical protein
LRYVQSSLCDADVLPATRVASLQASPVLAFDHLNGEVQMRRNQSLSGRSVLRVGIVVVAVLAAGFLAVQQVNFVVGRALLVAFGPDTDSTYRRAWFDWDGDITAQDVVLHLGDADDAQIRFASLRVETPGWFWFARSMFDRRQKIARLDRLHLTLEGMDTEAGIDPTLGDLGPIGALSASPFEAEGCAADGMWTRTELSDMGLMPEPTTLDFEYSVQQTELVTKILLGTPGVSRVQFERHETLAKPMNALLLDNVETMTRSERWEVSDQGFVKARNAFCAKKDGIDTATFVSRHVDAVQRVLQTRGLAVDAATLAAYRDFASIGGQLVFGGGYAQPLHSSELYEARDDGSAMLRLNGVLEHGTQKATVQWSRFAPRPLDPRADSTWAAMQAEGGTSPGATPTSTIVATTAGAAATPATATSAVAAPAAPALPGAVTTTADGRPLASSLPVAQLASPGATLAWSDLPRYQGHVMQVRTMHNEPRTAVLMAANGGEAQVRASVGGGHAEYRIKREAFISATLIQ